jgi:hypothetical protein
MSGFANSIIGGAETLIRKAIRSANYVAGVAGWTINKDGSAEFSDVTIRGDIALSDFYAPITSVYDASSGGAPTWATVGSFVAFSGTAWASADVLAPASGRVRYDIKLRGMDNATATATLIVDLQVLESSGQPGSAGFVGPGTEIHTPNTADGAVLVCQVAGATAADSAGTYLMLEGLTPGQWYRLKPFWRIGAGGAANITFQNLVSYFTASPVV